MELKDGLHFGLAEDVYHAIPALSASGIKNMMIHPAVFWAGSWMNVLREDNETADRLLGRAYHKRILEGKAAFDAGYAPKFEHEGDCLRTMDDLKGWLENNGLPKSGKTKDELIARVLSANASVPVYDVLRGAHEAQHHGKVFLDPLTIARMELAAAMIEKNPALRQCFSDGLPEVTVVWTAGGIRFKARFDYLKAKAVIDFKTFDSFKIKAYDRMVYEAMASYKYHVQAAFYGDHAAPAMVAAIKAGQVFTHSEDADLTRRIGLLTHQIAQLPPGFQHGMYFVFQMKNPYPIATGRKFPRTGIWQAGLVVIEQAIEIYKSNTARFGTDPWLDSADIQQFEDDHFPAYINDV